MTRLCYERKARKLSQMTLARAAGINQPDLSMIERGRLVPTEAQLARIAAALDLPAGELLKEVVVVREAVA